MKFSRNPKSGILETYSDDGIYQGSIITMGDTLQEYEERKARPFNMDMIEKIQLRSENVCYGPCPEPEDEVEQRLTITSKGRVWLSRYKFGDGSWQYKLVEKRSFNIPKDAARMILTAIGEYFSQNPLIDFATDVGSWELTLTDTFGKECKAEGPLVMDLQTDHGGLSNLIRDALGLHDLFAFDGNDEEDEY